MAEVIVLLGDTGYGKTTSFIVPPDGIIKKDKYEGMNPFETVWLNLDGKPIMFQKYANQFPEWKSAFTMKGKNDKEIDWFESFVIKPDLKKISKQLKVYIDNPKIKNIVIDTFSEGMYHMRMGRENEKNFDRWSDLALAFWKVLENSVSNDRDDLHIWILNHVDIEKNREGETTYKSKVEGNLLDKQLEKLTNYVFFATKQGGKYIFETTADNTTAKTPPLLFDELIPNSMKLIDNGLRESIN